uniref:Dynein heavy chain 7, axonemal-like isoform X2 n=1 Tax=Petromyzon marinus TaxID=7757 RepID=A0AAJ7WLF7_PETMA|nr:dynein heavy chain 7, axonemal-like isoform X2 [Petromyzon marinus]
MRCSSWSPRAFKVVAGKQETLAEAQAELGGSHGLVCTSSSTHSARCRPRWPTSRPSLNETKRRTAELEDQSTTCSKKLQRAEVLTGAMGAEKTRWSQAAQKSLELRGNLTGDALISAGNIAYPDGFTFSDRQTCF